MKVLSGNKLLDANEQDSIYLRNHQRDYANNVNIKKWEELMKGTDHKCPRYIEDIYDVLSDDQKNKIPSELQSAILLKKQLRSQKP